MAEERNTPAANNPETGQKQETANKPETEQKQKMPNKAKVLAHIRHSGKIYGPGKGENTSLPLQGIPKAKVDQLVKDGFIQL